MDGRERERERDEREKERERYERTLLMHGSPTSHPCDLIGGLISINSNEPEPHTQRERERERERERGMTHSIEGPREASCGIEQADQRHAWSIETKTSRGTIRIDLDNQSTSGGLAGSAEQWLHARCSSGNGDGGGPPAQAHLERMLCASHPMNNHTAWRVESVRY